MSKQFSFSNWKNELKVGGMMIGNIFAEFGKGVAKDWTTGNAIVELVVSTCATDSEVIN